MRRSLVAGAALRALGATPVFSGGGAPLTGLDGVVAGISAIENAKQDRAGGWLTTDVVPWARPTVLFASRRALERLTDEQRTILARAAAASAVETTKAAVGADRYDTSVLCAHGRLRFVAAGPQRIAALRRAVAPVYAQLERDPQTRRW